MANDRRGGSKQIYFPFLLTLSTAIFHLRFRPERALVSIFFPSFLLLLFFWREWDRLCLFNDDGWRSWGRESVTDWWSGIRFENVAHQIVWIANGLSLVLLLFWSNFFSPWKRNFLLTNCYSSLFLIPLFLIYKIESNSLIVVV